MSRDCADPSLLEAASFIPRSLQWPAAWCGHLPFAAWLVKQLQPAVFVELGTHTGNSYFTFCQAIRDNGIASRCYAVDTWQGDAHAGYYGDEVHAAVEQHNSTHYGRFSELLRMSFDDALAYFSGGSIELLHIDGLHTYEAVRHDFDQWRPKLAPGAVVLLHDTNVRERDFGVWQLWEELCEQYPNHIEFTHSHGLGVLQLDNGAPDRQLRFLQPGGTDKQQLRDYFAALGESHVNRFNARQGLDAQRQADQLADTLAQCEQQVATLQSDLDAVKASSSWRITQPMRWLAATLRTTQRRADS